MIYLKELLILSYFKDTEEANKILAQDAGIYV